MDLNKLPIGNEVDNYILQFPEPVREILQKLRKLILEIAPDAIEMIAYGMPAYKTYNKPLVYFAAFSNHIGFYATPTGHSAFHAELSKHKQGKGSVQFSLSQPIPFQLIEQIVRFRVAENIKKYGTSKKSESFSTEH